MKKLFICAFAALALMACSSNPTDEAVALINKATEKVEKATTVEEVDAASNELADEMRKLKEKHPDYEAQGEDKDKILEATKKFGQAVMGKSSLMMDKFAAPAEPAAAAEDNTNAQE